MNRKGKTNTLTWLFVATLLFSSAFGMGMAASSAAPAQAATSDPVLLIGIGMHVEALGTARSSLVPGPPTPPSRPNGADYNDPNFFNRHVEEIRMLAEVMQRHGAKLTLQAQTPFTQMLTSSRNALFADLQARGHEVGLHFDEGPHLGRNPEQLSVETWAAVMAEEIGLLKQAGATSVRYWSGGNVFTGVLDAGSRAGLDSTGDYKSPTSQQGDQAMLGVNPWRPAGGPSEASRTEYARHDPNGKIVYLPLGAYSTTDQTSVRRALHAGNDAPFFAFMTDNLQRSLAASRPGYTNIFHMTIGPGDFRGTAGQPYASLENWLTTVLDPMVRAGKARYATYSEMTDSYKAWEKANPGVDPRTGAAITGSQPSPSPTPTPCPPTQAQSSQTQPSSYMSFIVNVHDHRNVDDSANTLLRLASIFQKYGVRGDFYLTAPVAQAYVEKRPDVIEKLRSSNMTISYHYRPPHPAYDGFDARLQGLSDAALEATLRDYETYRLDMATGGLDKSKPGGYSYVKQVFGEAPVTISALAGDQHVKGIIHKVYKDMGAQAAVIYHESGTDPKQPFKYRDGLLERPSDFSVTRWTAPGVTEESFWWNMLFTPQAAQYDPVAYLKIRMAGWKESRAPFVTSLVHENNFYRSGPAPWSVSYYRQTSNGTLKAIPPPYDLNAPDTLSRPRSAQEQAVIWDNYEKLVAYAASNMRVATSEDIVALAAGRQTTGSSAGSSGPCPGNQATPTPTQTVKAEPGPEPDSYFVKNPNGGARLYVKVVKPKGGQSLGTLVLIPGGVAWSSNFLEGDAIATRLAEAGYTAVIFDPDGRGKSEGTDDFGGHVHQDGLSEIARFAAGLPESKGSVGFVSFSYGVTSATGALARYPDLPVRFLIDWEGPADRNDTTVGCKAGGRAGPLSAVPCTDDAYWAQREAVKFVGQIRVPYRRIQSEKDHVQPDLSNAVDMINAAVKGGVPWVRLNDHPAGQTYDPAKPPAMLPESMDKQRAQTIAKYVSEMPAPPTQPAARPGTYSVAPQFADYYNRYSGGKVLGPPIGPVLTVEQPVQYSVQYFEKGRLEDHSATDKGAWAYAFGLLVPELINAKANVRVAGDSGPTYAELAALTAPSKLVALAKAGVSVNPNGSASVPFDPALAGKSGHNVPAYFWAYMNDKSLFPGGWLHDVGLPMSETFTIQLKKGSETRQVTLQVFERTILSYDPKNPAGFQVERANVGLSYRDAFREKVGR